jgi:outer membrane protein TolC
MNIHKILVYVFFVGLSQPSRGQSADQPLKLGLMEAVDYAKTKSPSARVIKFTYQSASWQYVVSKSMNFPNISIGGNLPGLNRSINSITQNDGTVLYLQQSLASSRIGLNIEQNILPTGGSIFVSSGLGRIDLFGNQKSNYWQSQPVIIGISQPLFKFNRMKWTRKQDILRYNSAGRQRLEAIEDLSMRVTNAWFELYMAQLQLSNAALNVQFNDTLFKISKGRFDLGKIAETDLLQMEFALLNAQNMMEQTRLDLGRAEEQLKNILGIDKSTKIELSAPPGIIPMLIDTAEAVKQALENRSDIEQMKIRKNDAIMNMKESSLNRFFQADLNANFGLNQTATDLSDAYKNPLNSQNFNVGFNIPVASFGRNRGNYLAAKNNYDAVVADMENNINSLMLDVKTAALQVKQLEKSVQLSQRAFEIAEKRYDLSRNRFLVGKIDMTNLTIAQNEKDNSLLSYLNNLQNYWIAYFRLRRLTLFDFEKMSKIN